MKNCLIIACLIILTLSGCNQKKIELGKDASFKIEKDLAYGDDKEQVMDLYIPEILPEHADVFIIIHGGGWRGGRRSQLTSFTFDLMKKFPKSIFVNMDYRLATTTSFALPAQTDDIKSAMGYLEKKLKIKPRYILLGNSAGGHLSMIFAYQFDKDKKVKAVINIVGPADLNDPGFKNYVDYTFVEKHLIDPKIIGTKTTLMNFGSPVHWISTTSAPTLSYYGMNDRIVPLSQMKILDSVLNKNNVYHESYEFSGDHVGWEKDSNAEFLIQKTDAFLKNVDKK